MRFDIITLFPEIFEFYFNHSILKKAKEKGIIKIKVHNLRDFASDKHKTVDPVKSCKTGISPRAKSFNRVDDKPFGGGRGMVLKVEPIFKAVSSLRNPKSQDPNPKSRVILFTPRGKKFTQKMAMEFSKLSQLILICGRYEGVDERVAKYLCDEKISIGDYVLMGGELPALVVIESVARLVPGVIGKSELLKERLLKKKAFWNILNTQDQKFLSPKRE